MNIFWKTVSLLALTVLLSFGSWSVPVAGSTTANAGGQTVVSLEFDDGVPSHLTAQSILNTHGMKGTFYVSSGRVGKSGFLNKNQLLSMQADGHEIGGHTINHVDLAAQNQATQTMQIVEDKRVLEGMGLNITNFSYPFGSYNSTTQQIVQTAGYEYARTVGGIGCSGCRLAETIPPKNAYVTETPSSIKNTTSLSAMQAMVTKAENAGGGWVQLVMHKVDNSDETYSIKPETLISFLEWLQLRQGQGTVVKTVRDVSGNTQPPAPIVPTASLTASSTTLVAGASSVLSWNTTNATEVTLDGTAVSVNGTLVVLPTTTTTHTLVAKGDGGSVSKTVTINVLQPSQNLINNPSLEFDTDGDGVPDNWQSKGWGTITSSFARTSDSHTGSWAERIDIATVSGGDQKIVTTMKDLSIAPVVIPGKTYSLSTWFKSNTFVRFVVYYRNSSGKWIWLSESSNIKSSGEWTQANWATPAIPEGATNVSVGFMIKQPGFVVFDDMVMVLN